MSPTPSLLKSLWLSLQNNQLTPTPTHSSLSIAFSLIFPILNTTTSFQASCHASQVLFWHHNWGHGLLLHSHLLLFQHSLDPYITLSEVAGHLLTGRPLHLFQPRTHSNILFLQSIQTLLPSLSNTLLHWISSTSTGSPTSGHPLRASLNLPPTLAKNFYNFLMTLPKLKSALSTIFQKKLPPRLKLFLWKVSLDRLPTLDNLRKRGWIIANGCILCKQGLETILHLFEECLFYRQLLPLLGPSSFFNVHLQQRIEEGWTLELHHNKLVAFALYFLWKERCNRIFRDKEKGPVPLARLILLELAAWDQAHFLTTY